MHSLPIENIIYIFPDKILLLDYYVSSNNYTRINPW